TRNLHDRIDEKEIVLLRLALREMVFNAIEHGNLGISFEDKTAAMAEDRYFALIRERQNDPAYAAKQVTVEYQLDHEKISYLVTDEGKGFNHHKMMNKTDDANDDMIPHGRGVSMAKNIFSSIRYNRIGNSVLMEKRFIAAS
ncbi:MAG TPA: ATP-binding protein, partial [Spirochaetota bacterium]